jgi:proteasome lid subunit RPN8/RPN11
MLDQPMPLDRSIRWFSRHENKVDPRVHVFLAQSAYQKCVEHAASDLAHEVGGVLIGTAYIDTKQPRPYILIQDILPALYTNSGQAHVTFTQDTMVYLHNELEARFPGKRMVGWYHTHPRFGIFLSSYDSWLHQNFFRDPTQIALVIDPCAQNGGIFCWQPGWKFDPVHYVGFYELSDVDEESIVEWDNLTPVIDESPLDAHEHQEMKGEIS